MNFNDKVVSQKRLTHFYNKITKINFRRSTDLRLFLLWMMSELSSSQKQMASIMPELSCNEKQLVPMLPVTTKTVDDSKITGAKFSLETSGSGAK